MDYDETGNEVLPALNTYVIPDPVDSEPFNHAARLVDKLVGAVEIAFDNVLFDQKLQNEINNRTIKQVSSPVVSSALPPAVDTFLARNSTLLIMLTIIGALVFFVSLTVKR